MEPAHTVLKNDQRTTGKHWAGATSLRGRHQAQRQKEAWKEWRDEKTATVDEPRTKNNIRRTFSKRTNDLTEEKTGERKKKIEQHP